jgi:hypothetical protein
MKLRISKGKIIILVILFFVSLGGGAYLLFKGEEFGNNGEEFGARKIEPLTDEETAVLDELYFQACHPSDTAKYLYKNPCSITLLNREERYIVIDCENDEGGRYDIANPFIVECVDSDKYPGGVSVSKLYVRAKEENDNKVLNDVYKAAVEALNMEDSKKFDLIDSQMGNPKSVIRLVAGEDGNLNIVKAIKFVVEDVSVCNI